MLTLQSLGEAGSDMQGIIEELIRWLGYVALKVLTLGRYRRGRNSDGLAEGAVGFGVVVGIAVVIYSI